MISDFVKGKKKFDYAEEIQQGITLHRLIDQYTDEHAAVKSAKSAFRPVYRLYSGALVDVVFDHFLATDPMIFSKESLGVFTQATYQTLDEYSAWLPDRFAAMFPYMKSHDWLFNYRYVEGIEKSLAGVVRRAAYINDSGPAFELFKQNYQLLQELYRPFWTDLHAFAQSQSQELLRSR
jgi:acyl carrier protein phosphodiesterase